MLSENNKLIFSQSYSYIIFLLRNARKKLKLTQTELSKKLNKNDKYVTRYELCQQRLDILEVLEICLVLEVNFLQLMKTFQEQVINAKSSNNDNDLL